MLTLQHNFTLRAGVGPPEEGGGERALWEDSPPFSWYSVTTFPARGQPGRASWDFIHVGGKQAPSMAGFANTRVTAPLWRGGCFSPF
ncbi:MAG: hypothetical protein CM15mP128_0680 [Methanobacteriota archaeon]|nr:MAG: hypothetical protein CM15mP128_0680 [Euryarchaeota archaeon]